ncbi:MAG TPA: replicative DNA helicase [bacterium]|nr:replicative DNA helicase [Patescibacteria group bacterium]HOC96379.1 replicative DNA helicase [bacterium]HPO11101.1 replicative DNA helicase [bacterium]
MSEPFLPPQNLEAEKNLLGALLIDKDAITEVADIITAEDFYSNINGIIYDGIVTLYEKRQPTDIVNLSNLLEERKQLDIIGGRVYLIELMENTITSANCVSYAKIISKKATLRRLISTSAEITELAYNQEENDVEETLDIAEQKLFNVSKNVNQDNFIPLRTVLNESFERIDNLSQNRDQIRGVPSGFNDLDKILAGFQKSDLIIIASRPSVGKTSFALDIARNASIKHKAKIALFSLEMSREQLTDRMVSAESGIDLWKIRTGHLSDDQNNNDFEKIGEAISRLSEANLFIDDSGNINVMQIRSKCRRLKAELGLDMVIIDYLQLIQDNGSDNRNQEISIITRALKALAKELDVPVIALSQLSRAVEMSKPAIPKLAHLRESGSIEQDADVVLFIYRKAVDRNYRLDEIAPEERNIAEIHIAKHRNGACGEIKLYFDGSTTTFKNLAADYKNNIIEI